jgi:hypothetical protein
MARYVVLFDGFPYGFETPLLWVLASSWQRFQTPGRTLRQTSILGIEASVEGSFEKGRDCIFRQQEATRGPTTG